MKEIILYLFGFPCPFDFILMTVCILSSIIGSLILPSTASHLDKTYGDNSVIRGFLKNLFYFMWTFSGFLLLLRSVVVGIKKFSFSFLAGYISVVLISVIIVLFLPNVSNEMMQKKFREDIDKINNQNPIYTKIIEILKDINYKTIFFFRDRIVFTNKEFIECKYLCETENISEPTNSNEKAKIIANQKAIKWQYETKNNILAQYSSENAIIFSKFEYGELSDVSMKQLINSVKSELKLKHKGYEIKKHFHFNYTSSYSYMAGVGETLRQKTDQKTYSADAYGFVAKVLYLSIEKEETEKNKQALTSW